MSSRVVANIDKERPEKMARAVKAGLTAVGIRIEGEATLLCPVNTGRLRGSITWATGWNGSKTRAPSDMRDAVEMPTRDNVVHIGSNVEYAPYIEYGTRKPKRMAKPFLRPAFDDNRQTIKDIFAMQINKAMGAKT
jgi:HK97 gp10 family phage protein